MAKVSGPLNKRFQAHLQKSPAKGGWTYLVMPDSAGRAGTESGQVRRPPNDRGERMFFGGREAQASLSRRS
jgi:hypothetical protein